MAIDPIMIDPHPNWRANLHRAF